MSAVTTTPVAWTGATRLAGPRWKAGSEATLPAAQKQRAAVSQRHRE